MKKGIHRKPRVQVILSGLKASAYVEKTVSQSTRWGSVLLVVVVVIAMLTLAAYNFAQTMTTELEAAAMYTLDVQARATADSGVEFVATMLGNRQLVAENLIHNPQLFMGQVVSASPHLRANSRFSIISPVEHDTKTNAIRYGLMDESAKLNLNHLPDMGLDVDQIDTLLMNIPGVTIEISEAIQDWMDSDDTKNPYGAESETYEQMSPAYKAKNGRFETIDELLLVNGITPSLLYGEDANRNGLLDPNENDGDVSPPLDNADGVLNHGFVAYFSVHSSESNRKKDGTLKINVNDGFLTELYDKLLEAFDEKTAKFIIAYRISGPTPDPGEKKVPYIWPQRRSIARLCQSGGAPAGGTAGKTGGSTAGQKDGKTGGQKGGSGGSGGSQQGSKSGGNSASAGGSTAKTVTTSPQSLQDKEAAKSLTDFLAYVARTGGKVTRGGIDLSKGGSNTIESLWSLIGVSCKINVDGTPTPFPSPWSDDASSITTVIPDLFDKLTTTKEEFLEGRVNINQARREVLLGLPNMTEEMVNNIIAAQRLDSNGQPSLDTIRQHTSTAWLYAENVTDLKGMIALEPFITSHGDVYRVQVLGFFDGGGPVSRLEAMIDATQLPPRIIAQRDLNELGRGYLRSQLLQQAPK